MRSSLLFDRAALSVGVVFSALAIGCSDSEIKTYRVAKDDSQSAAAHNHAAEAVQPQRPAVPHVHSETPEGWRQLQPDRMRVASYQINGSNGRMANVALIPLPGVTNIALKSVNLWREELGLEELESGAKLEEQTHPVEVGDTKGFLVDLAGTSPRSTNKVSTRTIGAVAERGGITWFAKMTGEDSLVAEQKQAFTGFLKSIQFHEGSHAEAAEKPISTNTEKLPPETATPKWKIPDNWKEKPPGPMVSTAFAVAADNGEADVTISRLPGDAGGPAGNINRWRRQLGLPELALAEARQAAEPLPIDGKTNAYVVDIKGNDGRRTIAVAVPEQGETSFYKLMGPDAVVGKEKDAFVQFIKSAY